MRCVFAVPALIALATASAAAGPLPARPTRYATDHAKAFDAARLDALNERLAAFERETSNQVLVYVDRRVPAGTTLEEMSSAAMRAWGVGQKGKRNGVALFVFVDDRAMRIEVGYGLEGALPDATAHRITDGVIKPHFKKGDYAAGVEAGVTAIVAAVGREGHRGTGVTAAEKARGARPAAAAASSATPLAWLWPLVMLAIAASLVYWIILAVRRNAGRRNSSADTGASFMTWGDAGSSWSSSSDSDSSSSSDSGSSDFSGGGGDSGGGGSSDSS